MGQHCGETGLIGLEQLLTPGARQFLALLGHIRAEHIPDLILATLPDAIGRLVGFELAEFPLQDEP